MLLEESSPLGYCSKILLESSLWGSSEEYCYVWNRLDTKFALSAFRLMPLGQSTEESGCLLWRTPVQGEKGTASCTLEQLKAYKNGVRGKHSLANQVAYPELHPKLWPTPNSGNFNDGEDLESWEARRQKNLAKHNNGNGQGTPLAIAAKLWPTPTDHGNYNRAGLSENSGNGLATAAKLDQQSSGSLNPRFVEELMGFPIDHTALKP